MSDDLWWDAEEQVSRDTEEEVEKIRLGELAELRDLLKDPKFRRFLWRLISECGIGRMSFTSGDRDHTNVNEGKRYIGFWTIAELEAADKLAYGHMIIEEGMKE